MEEKMKNKSLSSTVSLSIAVSWIVLSTASAFAITDLGILPGGPDAGTNNPGQKPRFISNAVLVKLTAQARTNLKAANGEVNPAATGLRSLDVICRDHGVQRFSSIL